MCFDISNNLLFYIDCRDEVRLHGFTVVAVIQGATSSIINTLLESLYLFEVRNALEGNSSLKKKWKERFKTFYFIEPLSILLWVKENMQTTTRHTDIVGELSWRYSCLAFPSRHLHSAPPTDVTCIRLPNSVQGNIQ